MPETHDDEVANLPSEQTALLGCEGDNNGSATAIAYKVTPRTARRLYLSHFLSTWNSRMFEFAAVLYLATIFPGTLLPMSLYALTRVFQRLAVSASCAVFYVLFIRLPVSDHGRAGLLTLLSVLACAEKLYSIINMVSVEKDWVVVLAEGNMDALAALNAQMRRIDLLCKLLAPLFIALIDGVSTEIAIIVNFAMNTASVVVEYYAIKKIYDEEPELQERKPKPSVELPRFDSNSENAAPSATLARKVRNLLKESASDFGFYFSHRTFLPSFAGSLLYLTVLSFSGQMVTYLVASGYNTTYIGFARTISVIFEVLATWVAPWLIGKIGPLRAGLWLSNCQVLPLIGGLAIFWVFTTNPLISATSLVVGTIISRLGLRGFDLCTQIIVQEEVEAESRGRFSTIEAAWQSVFEILSYLTTIVFFRPAQFKWPASVSVMAVTSASLAYTTYVARKRGHLIHYEKFSF
ncbi:putative iron transporter [Colletotrichum sublineola]|uniref:Solute carrier family 40 member n=1 Tax=Colletotrichum sublineola TaxID=1173701 RepID=A0A066XNC3_COLSU|nr:putative iron transporter [Colletotrichum sublineola]